MKIGRWKRSKESRIQTEMYEWGKEFILFQDMLNNRLNKEPQVNLLTKIPVHRPKISAK